MYRHQQMGMSLYSLSTSTSSVGFTAASIALLQEKPYIGAGEPRAK